MARNCGGEEGLEKLRAAPLTARKKAGTSATGTKLCQQPYELGREPRAPEQNAAQSCETLSRGPSYAMLEVLAHRK